MSLSFNVWFIRVMAFNSAYSPTPECGYSVRNSHPAGRDVGPSSCGRTEWRHPGLQGQTHTFLTLLTQQNQVPDWAQEELISWAYFSIRQQYCVLFLALYKHLNVAHKRLHLFHVNHY